MNNIVSWEYYSSLHNVVSEADFGMAEAKAEKEVIAVIGPIHWANISEETFGFEILKDCICNVIDQQAEDELAGLGKGITSVTNDGYTESYAQSAAQDVQASMRASICHWLSGTGLVSAY